MKWQLQGRHHLQEERFPALLAQNADGSKSLLSRITTRHETPCIPIPCYHLSSTHKGSLFWQVPTLGPRALNKFGIPYLQIEAPVRGAWMTLCAGGGWVRLNPAPAMQMVSWSVQLGQPRVNNVRLCSCCFLNARRLSCQMIQVGTVIFLLGSTFSCRL